MHAVAKTRSPWSNGATVCDGSRHTRKSFRDLGCERLDPAHFRPASELSVCYNLHQGPSNYPNNTSTTLFLFHWSCIGAVQIQKEAN